MTYLIENQPDWTLLVRRDGIVLEAMGGKAITEILPSTQAVGAQIRGLLEESFGERLLQSVRRAIAGRESCEVSALCKGRSYEIRAVPQGPDRAICTVRASLDQRATMVRGKQLPVDVHVDRRRILERYKDAVASATLADRSLSVAAVYLDGISDIARSINLTLAEQVAAFANRRVGQGDTEAGDCRWWAGQVSDNQTLIVIESGDRAVVETALAGIADRLQAPIKIGDASFHLTPYMGVGVLGKDSTNAKALLDHARSAALEARRAATSKVRYFSDTLQVKALSKLDIARELRDAIENGHIGLRYAGRYDLHSGALETCVAYLRWIHPLRGEVRPKEFLRVAESTGLSEELSRSALQRLTRDFNRMVGAIPDTVRFSFGGLRGHILQPAFVADVAGLLDRGEIPAERLELRITERVYLARDLLVLEDVAQRGVHLVIDEVGRTASSLGRLARAPISGLQVDRSWVCASNGDPVAKKVCQIGVAMARAMGVRSIAPGIDSAAKHEEMKNLGFSHGLGDVFAASGLIGALTLASTAS